MVWTNTLFLQNTLTYTYFTNLSSVHSADITHYYTMYKTDSSAFSLLSVLSADGKIFPKLFPYFRNRQTPYPPIANYKQQQAVQVSFTSLMNTLIPLDKFIVSLRWWNCITLVKNPHHLSDKTYPPKWNSKFIRRKPYTHQTENIYSMGRW